MKVSTDLADGGKRISKTVSVTTNDPENTHLHMVVSGEVMPYITVEPRRVVLRGRVGEKIVQTVRIVPQTQDPLGIRNIKAVRGADIAYALENIQVSGKKAYALHLENRKQQPGRYYDSLHVETDSEVAETITIAVSGVILPPEEQGN